jgi:hypothetical protein
MTLELLPEFDDQPDKRDFLHLTNIILNTATDEVKLRGLLARRTRHLGGLFDTKLNEVALVVLKDNDDHRDILIQGVVEIALSSVIRTRLMEFSTNPFNPDSSGWRKCPTWTEETSKDEIHDGGLLTCRYVFVTAYNDAAARLGRKKAIEGYIRRIIDIEVQNEGFLIATPRVVRQQRSSAQMPQHAREAITTAKLTYGSGCCGAGGDALGASLVPGNRVIVVYGWVSLICVSRFKHDPC